MHFKIDENLPQEAADLLRSAGHDAVTVLQQGMGGSSDRAIASACQSEQRALITLDTDFADIRAYPPAVFPGLIVLRLRRLDKPHVLSAIRRLLPTLSREPLARHLWIVEETRLRIRS